MFKLLFVVSLLAGRGSGLERMNLEAMAMRTKRRGWVGSRDTGEVTPAGPGVTERGL